MKEVLKELEECSSEQWDHVTLSIDNTSTTIEKSKVTSLTRVQAEALYINICLQNLVIIDSSDISTCISYSFKPYTAITKLLINVSSMESYSKFSCFMEMFFYKPHIDIQ